MALIYPWQHKAWQTLRQMADQGRLGHALLCNGSRDSGLSGFSAAVAAWMLCKEPSAPCGQCRDCRQAAARRHPELRCIQPAEDAAQIKVQQIREMLGFMQLKGFSEARKIVIIDPAEDMNRSAANTLLKTLEEPMGPALMILVVRRLHGVPVTLRSRCQILSLRPDLGAPTRQWLRERLQVDDSRLALLLHLAQGRPLRAVALQCDGLLEQQLAHGAQCLELMQNRIPAIALARQWDELGAEQALSWLLFLLQTMARSKLGAAPLPDWLTDSRAGLQQHLERLQLSVLSECCVQAARACQLLLSPANFRTLGVLEELLLFCQSRLSAV